MKNRENAAANMNGWFWVALIIIAILAIIFRFWGLGADELTFDEGIYAFRSIGYLDYLENPDQVTPIQVFQNSEAPAWVHLSFHDHPPLFFAVGHLFFNVFGESLFVARLPSALEGLGSLVLMFLITRFLFGKLENEKLRAWKDWAGLFAASIMAVSFASVAVSRLDQLESLLFLTILANIYFFLRFSDDKRWWWAFGLSLGLCMLTKYTAVFLVPAYFLYLFVLRSPLLKNWRIYSAFAISFLIFLPVVIYNLYLYRTFGHFDLQFAYLFHQNTPEWRGIGGKSQEPFSHILTNVRMIYSPLYLLLGLLGLLWAALRKKLGTTRWFMVFVFIFAFLLLTATGSAVRFISLLLIPATFLITPAFFVEADKFKKPLLLTALAILFIVHEAYFTTKQVFLHPADYGIVKLDKYLDSQLGDARPQGLLTHPNPNLNAVIGKYAASRPATLTAVGLVYDDEISNPARLWLFSRRQYYHGIPVMPASEFLKTNALSGGAAFKGFGIYLVRAAPATTISPVKDPSYKISLDGFWYKLPSESKFTIATDAGLPAFEISHFSL